MASMKIEQLLVQHLYNHKEVTLQGMGTFKLNAELALPKDNDKDFIIPAEGLQFIYDNKATEDDALIQCIVQQTRKIKPLAAADLDSYLILGRQFLNIGKPFFIEGIGTLNKNQQGQFEFTPGNFITQKNEAAPSELKEKSEEAISFAAEDKPRSKKLLYILSGILIIGLAAWGGWFLLKKQPASSPDKETVTEKTAVPLTDTPKGKTLDSLPVTVNNISGSNGAYTFKIVFEVTHNKAAAEKRMASLIARGHKVIMYTTDSITYKLAEPFSLPVADTTRIKDSLDKWYYPGKARVEL